MTYTLGGHAMGTITKEDNNKDSQLFQMPMPVSDSSATIILDLFGATRTINVDGVWTTADGDIPTFILWLSTIINGNQSRVVFHSDKSNVNYNVYILSARWNTGEGEVNQVNYTISMMEGS